MNVNETKSEFKMSETILKELKKIKREIYKNNQDFKNTYILLKEEGASEEELEEVKKALKSTFESYNSVNEDIKDYEKKYNEFLAVIEADGLKIKETKLTEFYALEKKLCEKYFMDQKAIRSAEEPNKTVNESEKRKTNKISTVAMIAALAAALALGHVTAPAVQSYFQTRQEQNIDDEEENKEKSKKPLKLGEPGTLTDITDSEQVIARSKWYYETYFNKEFENLSDSKKERVSEENLADLIKIVHGKEMIYKDTDPEELNNYQNILGDMFCNFLSLEDRGNWGFVPTQYLYLDGSVEQKAAAQVDAVMEPLIKAMNEKNDELVVKYAKEFGELMKKQFYLLNIENDDVVAVRGECSNASKYHLWKLAYKQYTTKIFEYCVANDLNVCIDFCTDHNTKETVQLSLSALMATLEKIPMDNWDAVLARAGITAKQVEKLGNKYSGLTMSNIFIEDARDSLKSNMSLTLK